MAKQNNATCAICGKEYYKCISCKDSMSIRPWSTLTDTAEHYKIFQILRGYNLNVYTLEEARGKLDKVDLSDMETFKENIKANISEILNSDVTEVNAEVPILEEAEKKEDKIEVRKENSLIKDNSRRFKSL